MAACRTALRAIPRRLTSGNSALSIPPAIYSYMDVPRAAVGLKTDDARADCCKIICDLLPLLMKTEIRCSLDKGRLWKPGPYRAQDTAHSPPGCGRRGFRKPRLKQDR